MPIGDLLENPMFQFGMNMLGNMQYSDRPQTLAGGIGQAFQQTVQQARQRKILEMEQQRHEFESKTQDLQLKKYEQALKQEQRRAKLGEMLATSDLSPAAYQRIGAIAMAQGDTEFGLQLWKAAEGDELPAEVRSAQWAAKNPDDPAVKIWTENQRAPKTSVQIGGSDYGSISQDRKLINKGTPEEQIVPIPGAASEKLSIEESGKLTGLELAKDNIRSLRGLLFDQDGSVNRTNVALFKSGLGQGKEIYTLFTDVIRQKMLAESGQTVTEQEADRIASAFFPSITDTSDSLKLKLNSLDKYLEETARKFRNQRGGSGASGSWAGETPSEALRKQAEAQGLTLE